MAKTVDIEIFKIINAGNFWAHPIASPGSEFQDFMGKLNDYFRKSTTSQAVTQLVKGQMCVVRRTSDSCWYRARVQNVLQTLSGPQASVFLVDLAESTLVPCCWIREVPAMFQNIPVQAMECYLIGLKPLGLVTSYFDLTTSKQVTDYWDEAATGLFKTLIHGCKLQVSIQKQDEKGRYHVLLLADSGRAQICINDELVIKGFATYFSDAEPNSNISPTKAAKLKAMSDKFQKEGVEMLQNLKEYVNHGKFTGSEGSNSTDEELMDHRSSCRYVRAKESPLDVLRRQVSGRNSYQEEKGFSEPSARIPKGETQGFSSQRFSPGNSFEGASGGESSRKEQMITSRIPAVLSSDENSGRVRFLSSRLPATGSSTSPGFPVMPSKSPDSTNLKPILKKRSSRSIPQGSGSSSEQDDFFQRKHMQMDRDDSGVSCSETPELSADTSRDISLRKEPSASSNSISVDTLFGHREATSHSVSENVNFARKSEVVEPLTQVNSGAFKNESSPQKILSLIESLCETSGKSRESTSDSVRETIRTCEPSLANLASGILPGHEHSPVPSSVNKVTDQNGGETLQHKSQLLPTSASSTSSVKSPLPSEMLNLSSPSQSTSGTKLLFCDGVVILTEGAPAPKPITFLEHCPFAHYLPRLGIMQPKLIQQHAWPALLRGRDVVGICTANVGQIHAYVLPIIYQLVEERELYADLPKAANGPQFLILAPTWGKVEFIYNQCRDILARNRNIRVQMIFAAGAEENQILPIVNGCEILIATPPCFLRMLRKGYITLNRLCHTVFHNADLMVEDFTSEIKEIMRYYAKLLKSQPCRSAPRQAVVMASSWSIGVASLVKAYLGNPVLIIPDLVEAAIYRGVQQIATFCLESQRDVELLGYMDSFIATKDICVFAHKAAEAENIGKLLKANCYFALVAHEFLDPQELANVRRQWNTPHTTDAMPVLVMTDGVIDQMNITNASCVIHFNFPGNKTKFGRRLSTLAGTFTSSEEHGCASVIFVSDSVNMLHSPSPSSITIRQLVRRSGQEVPQWLDGMADLATQGKEKVMNICHSVKAFGTCRYKRGTRNCSERHSLLAELDKPVKGVPTSGIVKVLILNVIDASCYWVRILDHRPTDANQTSSNIADSTEFLELTMAVSGWYADPNHRVKQELVVVGDLCAVKLENSNSFHRVKVCGVSKEDPGKKPLEFAVHFVDRGVFESVHVDRLLQLPPQFHSCPFQAVEVFVCGVQPLDKDVEWTDQTSAFVAHLIEGKEMEGKVVLSLGNTMWLDPLVERRHLKSINVTTNVVNVRMELLKEKRATENKQHVRLLRNLCEGVIDLLPLEGTANSPGEISVQQSPALETVELPEDGFHSVYVSAVENPGLFFIQLRSSEESLEELKQKINSGVGRVDLEGSDITIGSFCVAKFSEDDLWYRARVLGSRPENEYDVFYVDFGDREWVTADRIVPAWKSILQLPLQAIECSLVNVDPRGNEWSEESSDAFWDMVNDQLLVAKVKSKSESLVAGCRRFAIELYNTNTVHDVIITHEMLAAGHAQSSPEGIKMLFPYSTPSGEQEDYDLPYQRIPDMCLQAHQCWDSAKKIEIVKQVQSIVLNNESSKDDIRDCGGIQGLCRLLSLNRDPLVLQHILASLASLSFENQSNCDEVRNQGGLQTVCYLLGKIEESAVQESIAWALKNLAATERNQNEARNRGGIKALCELLKNAPDEKVLERVTWAIGSLVQDNISNCQAVQECGGLKTLCELVAQTHSESVLERTTWALGMLAIDMKNRNFIRQYGGIENINKVLQESPSQQIVKQSALTLKTLASNNQYNRDVMIRLGMIGTLRSFMTDEPQRLGIISRRVCWDLLQRLLGSAASNLQTTSPQAPAPVSGTQGSSTSPGNEKRQEPEARAVNGLANNNVNDDDNDDDDDLPPLGGDDSDKENESALSINVATLPANASAKAAAKDNATRRVKQRNAVAAARPINHARPSATEDANIVPFSVHPKTVWSQTKELVRVCVKLRGVERQQTEITARRLQFRTQMGRSLYELDLELFEDIDYERSVVLVKGAEVQILLKKRNHAVWTRLLKSKEKLPYVSIDFDRWEVWSSSEEDEGDDDTNAQAAPTNPNNSRRDSEDRGVSKQVLLPEMLVSDSGSDEESVASDIDCFDFR